MPEEEKPAAPETPQPVQPPEVGDKAGRALTTTTIPALPVTFIGVRTPDSGSPIVDGQVVETPDHQPNLVVQVIRPVVALAVRAVSVFLKAMLAGMSLTGAGEVTQAPSLHWATWEVAVVTAASITFVDLLWNLLTIFGDLEKKHPLLTGSI